MDSATLVDNRIKNGQKIIDALKKKSIRIKDALWVYDEDLKKWKMFISSPLVKKEGPIKLYKAIDNILRNEINYELPLDSISVFEPNDNLIQMIKAAHGKRTDLLGFSPYEDTYIYFLSNGK